jgi:outer membrane protein assembly factor BamA
MIYCLLLWGMYIQTPNLYGQISDAKEKPIEGLDFGILPSFVYNTDKGLQYGALANFYYYGKGTKYPNYLYKLYVQSAITTRKGYVNYLFFDTRHLLSKGMRFTVDLSLVNRGFQQFYGLNGYNSLYNKDYFDPRKAQFISRYYYYFHEISRTIDMDLLGKLPLPHLSWDIGFGYYDISTLPIRTFRGHRTNRPTLFEKYIAEGVIPQNQKDGGHTAFLNVGLTYDSRNDEAIPTKGLWIQGIFLKAPSFWANKFPYSQVGLIYNQYISLTHQLVFAYRLAYQTKTSGEIPIYMMSYLLSTFRMEEALGGNKTIRGVLNERLIGNGFGLGNFEFRYIPISTNALHRNLNIGFNLFEDMGLITDLYKVDKSLNGLTFDYNPGKEKIHYSVGGGVRFIIDHNFIVALEYGHVLDRLDGNEALYLDLDYLF